MSTHEVLVGPLFTELFLSRYQPPHVTIKRLYTTQWIARETSRPMPDVGKIVDMYVGATQRPYWLLVRLDPAQMKLDLYDHLHFYVNIVQNIVPAPGPLSKLLAGDDHNHILCPQETMVVPLLANALLKQSPDGLYFYRNGHIRIGPRLPSMSSWKGSLARTRKKILQTLPDLGPCLLLVDDYQRPFTLEPPPNVQLCTLLTMRRHLPRIETLTIVVDCHLPGIHFEEKPSPCLVQLHAMVARSAGYLGWLPKNNSLNQTRTQLYLLSALIDGKPPQSSIDVNAFLETMRFHQCL
jgi:hypothetical protein